MQVYNRPAVRHGAPWGTPAGGRQVTPLLLCPPPPRHPSSCLGAEPPDRHPGGVERPRLIKRGKQKPPFKIGVHASQERVRSVNVTKSLSSKIGSPPLLY